MHGHRPHNARKCKDAQIDKPLSLKMARGGLLHWRDTSTQSHKDACSSSFFESFASDVTQQVASDYMGTLSWRRTKTCVWPGASVSEAPLTATSGICTSDEALLRILDNAHKARAAVKQVAMTILPTTNPTTAVWPEGRAPVSSGWWRWAGAGWVGARSSLRGTGNCKRHGISKFVWFCFLHLTANESIQLANDPPSDATKLCHRPQADTLRGCC